MKKKSPLNLDQPKLGYRYSVDALLLAKFIETEPHSVWIDLGTGCGIIPIAVAMNKNYHHCYAIEIQSDLCFYAYKNIKKFNLLDKISIIESDIRELLYFFPHNSTDFITTNPPYALPSKRKINTNYSIAIARYELFININDLLDVASYLLKQKGFLYIIYPYYDANNLYNLLATKSFNIHKKMIVKDAKKEMIKFVLIKTSLTKCNRISENILFIQHNMNI